MSCLFIGIKNIFQNIKKNIKYSKLSNDEIELEEKNNEKIDFLFFDNTFDVMYEFPTKTKEDLICEKKRRSKIKKILTTFFNAYEEDNCKNKKKLDVIFIVCKCCNKQFYLYEYKCCICSKIFYDKCNIFYHTNTNDYTQKKFSNSFINHIKECIVENKKKELFEILSQIKHRENIIII